MTKRILIIVDAQGDFIFGSLPVPNAQNKMNLLAAWLRDHKDEFDVIVLTADWHPVTHCSFKNNGGDWPDHCVQFSQGAAIYQPILDALKGTDYVVLTKGLDEDHEEYSIWKNHKSNEALHKLCDVHDINEVYICGLAGDICVLNSTVDTLRELPSAKIKFLKEYSPCIGDGNKVDEFIASTERVEIA